MSGGVWEVLAGLLLRGVARSSHVTGEVAGNLFSCRCPPRQGREHLGGTEKLS